MRRLLQLSKSIGKSGKGDLSELLKHEIDHLDGILVVERAIDNKSFALRQEWAEHLKN